MHELPRPELPPDASREIADLRHQLEAALKKERQLAERVTKYEHRWASQQERNLAVLMQGMAESLAASISHQDQKDRITRRAHGGRYTGWA